MPLKIKSTFAILDVETGRGALGRACKKRQVVPVTIRGYVEDIHGFFDGTSQEFQVWVESVEAGDPVDKK
jgi:hypothetical protein